MSEKEGAHDYTPEHLADAQEYTGSPGNPARATGLCGGGVCLPGGGLGQERAPWGCSTPHPVLPQATSGSPSLTLFLGDPSPPQSPGSGPYPQQEAVRAGELVVPDGLVHDQDTAHERHGKGDHACCGQLGSGRRRDQVWGGTGSSLSLGALGEVHTQPSPGPPWPLGAPLPPQKQEERGRFYYWKMKSFGDSTE